jgi:NADPH2 dehydrogenase
LIVEYSYVHPSGRSEEFQLGAWNDGQISGLAALARVIKDAGALAGIQLSHGGGKSNAELTHGGLMGPSGIAVPVKEETLAAPRAMSHEDIRDWHRSFTLAADRAVAAGFDLIELHSAHGYGLNQFLSAITNQRRDAYGGRLSSRARLLREIIATIRERHPSRLLSVRMPGQDFVDGGLTIDDTVQLASWLEAWGVDIIHVSSGIGGWRRPTSRAGEGYLVEEAALIQSRVSVPVIGVGGIATGTYVDRTLAEGRVALAAVGRAILANPRGWAEANLTAAPYHLSIAVPPCPDPLTPTQSFESSCFRSQAGCSPACR